MKGRLSVETVERTISNLLMEDLIEENISILFHDGEPTVLPVETFEKIVSRTQFQLADKAKPNFSIQTNGTLLNQEWCDFFKRNKFGVGLSMDGPEFIHNKSRIKRNGSGTYNEVKRGLDLLTKNQIGFGVISVITEFSLDYPDEIFNFFLENDVRRLSLNFEETLGINKRSFSDEQNLKNKVFQFQKRMFELQRLHKGKMLIREFDEAFKSIMNAGNSNFDMALKRGVNNQYYPFYVVSVNVKGDFTTFSPELTDQSHPAYGDFKLGNVYSDSFSSVVESPKFIQMFTEIYSGREKCKKECKYFNICGGAVPSNKIFENGTFDSSETVFCRSAVKAPFELVINELEKQFV